METRLNELLPYMRRLQHMHDLHPIHREMINRKARVINFKAKDARHDSDPR